MLQRHVAGYKLQNKGRVENFVGEETADLHFTLDKAEYDIFWNMMVKML